jgi:hypothetical protein
MFVHTTHDIQVVSYCNPLVMPSDDSQAEKEKLYSKVHNEIAS